MRGLEREPVAAKVPAVMTSSEVPTEASTTYVHVGVWKAQDLVKPG